MKGVKTKLGKSSRDIFAATSHRATAKERDPSRSITAESRAPGRPPVHQEDWTKITVILMERQVVYLDRLVTDIRAKTGASVSRAELIRAMIDAVANSKVDMTAAASGTELEGLLAGKLGR
jgi:hypothetical protein